MKAVEAAVINDPAFLNGCLLPEICALFVHGQKTFYLRYSCCRPCLQKVYSKKVIKDIENVRISLLIVMSVGHLLNVS